MKTKCRFERKLSLLVDGALSKENEYKMEKHIAECSICSRELEILLSLKSGIKNIEIKQTPPEVRRNVMFAARELINRDKQISWFEALREQLTLKRSVIAAVTLAIILGVVSMKGQWFDSPSKPAQVAYKDIGDRANTVNDKTEQTPVTHSNQSVNKPKENKPIESKPTVDKPINKNEEISPKAAENKHNERNNTLIKQNDLEQKPQRGNSEIERMAELRKSNDTMDQIELAILEKLYGTNI